MRLTAFVSIACLFSSALALDIRGSIEWNEHLKDVNELRPSDRIVLNQGERSTFIRKDGSFVFPDVPEGEYILEVLSNTHAIEPLYITIPSPDSIHIQPYHPLRIPSLPAQQDPLLASSSSTTSPSGQSQLSLSPSPSLPYPILLHPQLRLSSVLFDLPPSAGTNILQMFKSPMVLMLVFTGIMAIFAPKLLSSMEMDPEDAKSMKEMRERFQSVQTTDWGEKLAGKLAGVSGEGQAVVDAAPPTTASTANRRRKGR